MALVSFCNRTRVCRNPTLTLRPRGHPNTGAPGSTFFGRPPLTPRTLNDIYHRKSSTATTGRVETLGRGRPCRITGEGLSPASRGRSDQGDTCCSNDRSDLKLATQPTRTTRPKLTAVPTSPTGSCRPNPAVPFNIPKANRARFAYPTGLHRTTARSTPDVQRSTALSSGGRYAVTIGVDPMSTRMASPPHATGRPMGNRDRPTREDYQFRRNP